MTLPSETLSPTFTVISLITPPAGLREIQEQIPAARLVTIAGAGHLPPVERPDDFAAALREFLGTLPG